MISARTVSSAAASEPRAHKSDASHRTLRSLLRKNMADKNDSGGRGRGKCRAFSLEIRCRRATQLCVSAVPAECWRPAPDKLQLGTGV